MPDGSSVSPGMAHRIEIELTSQTDESTWTWRAAGAKQPRGTVDAALVPANTATGTLLRAEVETTLDGTTVLALLPPKGKSAPRKVETIEVVGNPSSGPDVNVVLASKSKGRRRDDRPEGPREGSRRPTDRRPRSESGERGGRRDAPSRAGSADGPGSDRRRERPARPGGREAGHRDGPRRPAQSTTYRNAAIAT
ncbi:MAG: hypothetical protein ACRDWB_01380, partial [Acidimicrobiales bacterium]